MDSIGNMRILIHMNLTMLCEDWEFYTVLIMELCLNCYPENIIFTDERITKND